VAASTKQPYQEMSLLDFQKRFPDEEACLNYLIRMRWPEKVVCSACGHDKLDFISRQRAYQCRKCQKQTFVTAGTIFYRSHIPIQKWFWAVFLTSTPKKGVSMLYLQKQLGIKSYRAAWLMGHKIRQAMAQRDARYMLKDTVQADEIFIGGKQSREELQKLGTNKTPFLIMVEEDRKSKPRFVSFEELETVYDKHLIPALKRRVKKGSHLKADGNWGYVNAAKDGRYALERSLYTKDKEKTRAHLKWINVLTSNLKRFLLSTYHGIHPKYRRAYLAEFSYRFNRRYWPYQAFDRLLLACVNAKPIGLHALRA
jgi:transposase-like protein